MMEIYDFYIWMRPYCYSTTRVHHQTSDAYDSIQNVQRINNQRVKVAGWSAVYITQKLCTGWHAACLLHVVTRFRPCHLIHHKQNEPSSFPIARRYLGRERKERGVGRRRGFLLILPRLSPTLQPLTLTLFMTTSASKTSLSIRKIHTSPGW